MNRALITLMTGTLATGNNNMEQLSALDDATVRTWLTARRAELEGLDAMSDDARDTVELDQTRVGRLSRIDALQGQQMAMATERRRQAELVRIDAALKRLNEGEYGACVKCGDDIADNRLKADPTVALCIDCASGG